MSTFALGQMQVRQSGYGAMQLAGPYAFGPPPDRATAIGVLRAAVAAGVDHIDTAQYYGSGVVNGLIRDALCPYPDGLAIVSKVAVRPDGGGAVLRPGDPDRLRQGIQDNLRSLRGSLACRPGCWRGCQAAHGGLKTPSWAMMVAMSSAAHSSLILPSATR
jgi:aryl-alcohol dehydrogenase-like predicted oxidoreductase